MKRELLGNFHWMPWLTFHPSSSEKTILHHCVLSSDLRERRVSRDQEPRKCPALQAGTSTKVLNPHYDSTRISVLVWQMGKLGPVQGAHNLPKATLPAGGEDGSNPRLSTALSRAHLE